MDSLPALQQSVAAVEETRPSNIGYPSSGGSIQCAARGRSEPLSVESVGDAIAVLAARTNVSGVQVLLEAH